MHIPSGHPRPAQPRLQRPGASAAVLALVATLAGCATPTRPLYQWESYQRQVYEYLKSPSSDAQKQIASLEQDFEKIKAQNRLAPPGFHAHLGLLYAGVGKDDAALQSFRTEKALFPESAPFIDMLLARSSGRKEKPL